MRRSNVPPLVLGVVLPLIGAGCRGSDIDHGATREPNAGSSQDAVQRQGAAPCTALDANGGPLEPPEHVRRAPIIAEVFDIGPGRLRPPLLLAGHGRSIAAVVEAGKEQFVMQEGHTQPRRFDEVKSPSYAPDGSGLCYFGRMGGGWYLVVSRALSPEQAAGYARWPFTEPTLYDEKAHHREGETFFEPTWGPLGGSLVLTILTGGRRRVLRDGLPFGLNYDETGGGMFSPDGRTFAFAARSGAKWLVIKGGLQVGGFYDEVRWFAFSADSSSFAFSARVGEDHFVVRDGVRVSRSYKVIDWLGLSADGGSFALVTRKGGRDYRIGDKSYVVKNNRRMGGEYDNVHLPLLWSPVGHSLAFVALPDPSRSMVIRDGTALGNVYQYVDPNTLVFSPDGRSLAFRATLGDKELIIKDGIRVHEEPSGTIIPYAQRPCFSPDGRSLAYQARVERDPHVVEQLVRAARARGASGISARQCVIKDGQRVGGEYDDVGRLMFSPDGRTLLFLARDGGKRFCVRDGVPVGGEYDCTSAPTTSKDGRRFIFAAMGGRTVYRVEVPW